MRKNFLWAVLSAVAIAGVAIAADATKPQYGTWGFDATGMDQAVKPGDNFFRFVSGTWLDKTPIPADKTAVSLRLAMTDRTEARLHDMMEAAAAKAPQQPGDLEGKVGAFYKAFMDEARIEKLGAAPIESELAAVRAAKTRDA